MSQAGKVILAMGIIGMSFSGISAAQTNDEIQELKTMIQEIRDDSDRKIKILENKINQMQAIDKNGQSDRMDFQAEKLAPCVKYVGRHEALAGDGGVVIKNPFGFGEISLGGYFDMEYYDRTGEESTFRQHRWIINLGAQVHPRIRFNSELEIEYGGPQSSGADGEVKVEQAYSDYLIHDIFNLRAGAVLAPFGRYNLYHDSDLQDLTDRPIMAKDVVPTTWTEAGYGFFGEWAVPENSAVFKYEIYAINGLDGGFSDTGLGNGRNSLKTDNNDNKSFVGRVSLSPQIGHDLGVSGYWGEYGASENSISGVGIDSFNAFGPFEFINEYAYFGVEEDTTNINDLANYFQGAYSQVNYHFWPKFLNNTFLGRGFSDPVFTLAGRYDWTKIHDDGDAGNGPNREVRYTLGLNYRPVESFVVKFEYQINQANNEKLEAGDNDGFVTSVAMGF